MQKKKHTQPKKTMQRKSDADQDRRNVEERRTSKCDGYTYIPMVGWYCRREETRRGDDKFS